jgi:hypothetical protein
MQQPWHDAKNIVFSSMAMLERDGDKKTVCFFHDIVKGKKK